MSSKSCQHGQQVYNHLQRQPPWRPLWSVTSCKDPSLPFPMSKQETSFMEPPAPLSTDFFLKLPSAVLNSWRSSEVWGVLSLRFWSPRWRETATCQQSLFPIFSLLSGHPLIYLPRGMRRPKWTSVPLRPNWCWPVQNDYLAYSQGTSVKCYPIHYGPFLKKIQLLHWFFQTTLQILPYSVLWTIFNLPNTPESN